MRVYEYMYIYVGGW